MFACIISYSNDMSLHFSYTLLASGLSALVLDDVNPALEGRVG